LVEKAFREPDFPDLFLQLIEIIHRVAGLKPLGIQGETFDYIFLESLRCPDAELRTLMRFHPVSNRNNHVQIVEIRRFLLKFGNPEFLHDVVFNKLTFGKYVFDMLVNGGFGFSEKLGHVVLSQPDGFGFQTDVEFDVAGGGLVEEELGIGWVGFVIHGIFLWESQRVSSKRVSVFAALAIVPNPFFVQDALPAEVRGFF
jgi:hypothetical protein